MKNYIFLLLLAAAGCYRTNPQDPLALIQIQDRNGLTETISNPDRLTSYETIDFMSSQPYKKVLRVYKADGKNHSKITTYHPNGLPAQYLEAEEMRAHGAYREWYPNGQLKVEANVIGGTADVSPGSQRDWLFESTNTVWDEQGNLIALIPYVKGMLDGVSIYYYPTGQIEKEIPFVKNEIVGEAVEFFPNGGLKLKSHYKRGVREGESIQFFETGQLAAVEKYTDGMLLSGDYYDLNGQPLSEITNGAGFQATFEEGLLTMIEFRMGQPEGLVQKFTKFRELQKTFRVKNNRKQGEEVEFFLSSEFDTPSEKPVPKMSLTWNDNAIHGSVKTWYPNGNLQSQREYSRNLKSGPSLAWYQDGSFMLLEEYVEDRIVSGQYFKINKSEPVSSILNGNGTATLFDSTGSFLRKVVYQKGKPVDPES